MPRKSYRSKTDPRIRYKSVVPGRKTTPGRIKREGHIIHQKRRREKRTGRKNV